MKWYISILVMLGSASWSQQFNLSQRGPEGGIVSLLTGTRDDAVVIAVVREAGVFRSADGGLNWQKVSSAVLNGEEIEVRDIVFHPENPDTVLIVSSQGLFRSQDKGVTFSAVPSFPNPRYSVQYSPANPALLFGSDENGPLKSTDGGKTWTALKDNQYFGNRSIIRVAVHPADTGNTIRLLAVTSFNDSVGLFFSNSSGASWRPFNKGLPSGNARRIYQAAIDTMGIGKIHFRAFIGTANGIFGLQSDLFDSAWTALKVNNLPSVGVVTTGTLVYDKFDLTAPVNDRHKFALYYALNASEFNGQPQPFTEKNGLFKLGSKYNSLFTLSLVEPPPVKRVFNDVGDISSVFIPDEKDKSKVYIGTTNGIYVSTDDGLTWERRNNGINRTSVRNVVSLPSVSGSGLLFAGVYGGGVMRSADDGQTWTSVNNGLANPYVLTLAADRSENVLYAGTTYSLYRSVDRGMTWSELFKVDSTMFQGNQRYTNRDHDMTVRHSPAKNTTLLLNSSVYGLWLSVNGGGTWTTVTPPSVNDSAHVPENIEFDPLDPNTFYIVTGKIFRTTDAGKNWTVISSSLPTQAFNPKTQSMDGITGISPTINPRNPSEIYLPTVFAHGEGIPYRLFKTTNGGVTWDPLSRVIPVYDVLYDRYDAKRVLAGGPDGLFRTIDGGNSWIRLTDSNSTMRYFLLSDHHADPNILYSGSVSGVHRLELNDRPAITVDTGFYDFGSLLRGKDSIRQIPIRNLDGLRNVIVSFSGLSDTLSFRYLGPNVIDIPAGGSISVPVRFTPPFIGSRSAMLRFTTTDGKQPELQLLLRGHAFDRLPFEQFHFPFGPVTVGKDSQAVLSIPNQSRQPITIAFQKLTDTVNFSYTSIKQITIDTGMTAALFFRFTPKNYGDHRAALIFSTSHPAFPNVAFVLSGTGIIKTIAARNIVIDTSFGALIDEGTTIGDYYAEFQAALNKAGLKVSMASTHAFSGSHSLAVIQPSLPITGAAKDSLLRFVINGGTLVLAADQRDSSIKMINQFLRDPAWPVATGLQFVQARLIDSVLEKKGLEGRTVSRPVRFSRYTAGVDSLMATDGAYLTIDTTTKRTAALFVSTSAALFTATVSGNVSPLTAGAVTAAFSSVGSGRIIAVADPELWWNGIAEDSLQTTGLYAAQNLSFAMNIFGSIENIIAELKETIQEKYQLISIPYTFEDSSVTTLFKDLGGYNSYLWRMFGKYSSSGYKEFPTDFSRISRGEGYWLITKEPKKISLGATSMPGVAQDFPIRLQPGWSLIGNPFPYPVSWQNSSVGDSVEKVIWSYANGKYDSSKSIMEPFKGYWVYNRGKLPRNIMINAAPVTTIALPKEGTDDLHLAGDDWKVRLTLESPGVTDGQNYLGVLKNALDGWDEEDFMKPPAAPSAAASLSLLRDGEQLSADYRAENSDGHVWDFRVTSSTSGEPMTIRTDQYGIVPGHFEWYLVDLKKERMYNVRHDPLYRFSFDRSEKSRDFRMILGTSEFLRNASGGIPVVPLEYALEQNHPNPFNPSTSILYTIANSGRVTLEIFNVLGQKVRILTDSHHPIGTYRVTWDGKDNQGNLLSSGIYFYQIQANSFRSVKKMTFVK